MNPACYFPGINLYVYFDLDKAAKKMLKLSGSVPDVVGDADTTKYENNIFIRFTENAEEQLYPLAAHEATHAAQMWCDMIGEEKPSSEEFAYMVQCVMICICKKYDKYMKKKVLTRTHG